MAVSLVYSGKDRVDAIAKDIVELEGILSHALHELSRPFGSAERAAAVIELERIYGDERSATLIDKCISRTSAVLFSTLLREHLAELSAFLKECTLVGGAAMGASGAKEWNRGIEHAKVVFIFSKLLHVLLLKERALTSLPGDRLLSQSILNLGTIESLLYTSTQVSDLLCGPVCNYWGAMRPELPLMWSTVAHSVLSTATLAIEVWTGATSSPQLSLPLVEWYEERAFRGIVEWCKRMLTRIPLILRKSHSSDEEAEYWDGSDDEWDDSGDERFSSLPVDEGQVEGDDGECLLEPPSPAPAASVASPASHELFEGEEGSRLLFRLLVTIAVWRRGSFAGTNVCPLVLNALALYSKRRQMDRVVMVTFALTKLVKEVCDLSNIEHVPEIEFPFYKELLETPDGLLALFQAHEALETDPNHFSAASDLKAIIHQCLLLGSVEYIHLWTANLERLQELFHAEPQALRLLPISAELAA